jgi:hypothetical protein
MKPQSLLYAGRLVVLTACVVAGCKETSAPVEPLASAAGLTTQLQSSSTHGNRLTAVLGQGWGTVNVIATAEDQGTFHAQIEVNVHDAPPNTTFLVQRRPDLDPDGACTGASFLTFPGPARLTTSAGGAGAIHIDFAPPVGSPYLTAEQFDVTFRLLEESPNPGATDLRTDCFTVTVKK